MYDCFVSTPTVFPILKHSRGEIFCFSKCVYTMLKDDDEKLHNSNIFMTLLTSSFCSQTTWEVIQASRRAHVSLAINKIDEVPVDVVCGVFYCEYMEKVDDGDVDDKKCLHDNKNPFKALSVTFFYTLLLGFFTWVARDCCEEDVRTKN